MRSLIPIRWRVANSLLLFCLCCILAVSCHRSAPDLRSPTAGNGRITLGTTATINTLDPADAYGTFPSSLLYNLSDRLYTYKLGTTDLEPQLATALPIVSADGLTYTVPLRQGVVFHDGAPFDAKGNGVFATALSSKWRLTVFFAIGLGRDGKANRCL
jgi:peptide/nickel transport system substrate-binding protein